MPAKKGEKEVSVKELQKKHLSRFKEIIKTHKKQRAASDPSDHKDFVITYGWTILVIIIGLSLFVWWEFYSDYNEQCLFQPETGILCEQFDATPEGISMELRNINNKTITVKTVDIGPCSASPNQDIPDNDKKKIGIACAISTGRLREKMKVTYAIDNTERNVTGKLIKRVA